MLHLNNRAIQQLAVGIIGLAVLVWALIVTGRG